MLLQTSRLRLREVVAEDQPRVLAYRADPRFLEFYDLSEYTEAHAREFVERFLGWQAETPRTRYAFAVTPCSADVLIGIGSLRRPAADSHDAEIGFELARDAWGLGYATEIAAELLRFGFADLGLHRIEAHCIAENRASSRVLEKIGMRLEGTLRDKQHQKGRYWNELRYAVLSPEWSGDPAASGE